MGNGVFIVLVLGLFVGLAVMGIYELFALFTRKVPTITQMVQTIILHFVPDELKDKAVGRVVPVEEVEQGD